MSTYPSPLFINGEFVTTINNINTSNNINHNHLDYLNFGNYQHLTQDQYNKATIYVSLTNHGLLKKDDYQKLFQIKNQINLSSNNYSGINYGNINGYIITNENNDGFKLKAPNSNKIYRINDVIESKYDLITLE
jgi:hypothetical protein